MSFCGRLLTRPERVIVDPLERLALVVGAASLELNDGERLVI